MSINTIHVNLWDIDGAVLIVSAPTNVFYSNQVGGTACLQKSLEGFLIPLGSLTPATTEQTNLPNQLSAVFTSGALGKTAAETLNSIQSILQSFPETNGISVDQKNVAEYCEAWIPVQVSDSNFGGYSGLKASAAVLTWPNSD